MKSKAVIFKLLLTVMILAAAAAAGDVPSHVVIDRDLVALKTDFNKAVDSVRLVFIISPA